MIKIQNMRGYVALTPEEIEEIKAEAYEKGLKSNTEKKEAPAAISRADIKAPDGKMKDLRMQVMPKGKTKSKGYRNR